VPPTQTPAGFAPGIRARFTQWFFSHFFRLLLVAVSVSEWGVLWWLVAAWVPALPWVAHLAGPAAIYGANRLLATRTQQRRQDRNPAGAMPRLYYAVAFTCLFCFGFLVLTGALWMAAKVLAGTLAVEARASQATLVIHSGLDTGFRWLANAGMALIALVFGYGYTVGQARLRVTRLHLPLRHAAPALHGLRIAQISDLHIGENIGRAQLERFVARVNTLEPHLICITGDISNGPAADLEGLLPVLARLRARHGVFVILGNHDHYAGADRVEATLRRLTPFTVLRDQHTAIKVEGAPLHVVGLDDRGRDWARGVPAVTYVATALAAIPRDEPVLLLCHRPDIFAQAAEEGVALTLSGHTHGGQIGVPWLQGRVRNLAEFITRFDRGLFERDGSYLYVNSGLGVTGQRIRLCTPREITLITVAADAEDEGPSRYLP
jgi:predicted MPP superfamily phosphohydrolase